ncbi:helix-turn-helix domain-containing protein [Streptomyces sp. NPDC058525]|uniref:helix-turn-helix domain-containing protein n=1 Tax=Streptomyces sp. NPDC058525 TaxID=3346538 RepID=UPI0036609B8E
MTPRLDPERLKAARLSRFLPVEHAAYLAGVSSAAWRAWERGANSPRITSIRHAADGLGVDPMQLCFPPDGDVASAPRQGPWVRRRSETPASAPA